MLYYNYNIINNEKLYKIYIYFIVKSCPFSIRGLFNLSNCIYSLKSCKLTKPKPFDFPLNASLIILLDFTDENSFLKNAINSSSSIVLSKLPTYT